MKPKKGAKQKDIRVRISAAIPESLHAAFKAKCKKDGVWMTDSIESLISKHCKRN